MTRTKEKIPSFEFSIEASGSSEEWDKLFRWVEHATAYYQRSHGYNPWFERSKTDHVIKKQLQILNVITGI